VGTKTVEVRFCDLCPPSKPVTAVEHVNVRVESSGEELDLDLCPKHLIKVLGRKAPRNQLWVCRTPSCKGREFSTAQAAGSHRTYTGHYVVALYGKRLARHRASYKTLA
jgi:hypothetical protein